MPKFIVQMRILGNDSFHVVEARAASGATLEAMLDWARAMKVRSGAEPYTKERAEELGVE